MWETISIILTLGGLEFTLWLLDRRAAKRDHEMQSKQLEILDGILTELAIQNSDDANNGRLPQTEEGHNDNAGVTNSDRAEKHPVCH
jgi:hypothetical protein